MHLILGNSHYEIEFYPGYCFLSITSNYLIYHSNKFLNARYFVDFYVFIVSSQTLSCGSVIDYVEILSGRLFKLNFHHASTFIL